MTFLASMGTNSHLGKDGKRYTLAPLTMAQIADFINWVRWKPYVDAAKAGLPKEQLNELKEDCKAGIVKEKVGLDDNGKPIYKEYDIQWESTIVQKERLSLDGIIKQIELSLEVNHPGVKVSDVFDENTLLEILEEVCNKSGIDPIVEAENSEGN